ncbi:MAG TPA: response regulator, partial [Nitrospirae bacterium]|nr:response regulator [Nitrospirota bacterium]
EPDKDIEIVFTGLRPGEKMYEALIADDESLEKTPNERMMIVKPSGKNGRDILEDISALDEIVKNGSAEMPVKKLMEMVPGFRPYREVVQAALKEKSEVRETGILVADDESIVQELLQKFLDGKGYNTILASNGRKALDIVKSRDVSIAIVDIKMPGLMDGFRVLRGIREINRDIKVILITGFGTEKTKVLSSRLGAYAYLEKPLDLVDVKKYVEEAVIMQKPAGTKWT